MQIDNSTQVLSEYKYTDKPLIPLLFNINSIKNNISNNLNIVEYAEDYSTIKLSI